MRKIRTSIQLVDILDSYLSANCISRREFCKIMKIPNSTISSWKIKKVLPSVEIVAKIAEFMNITVDTLVFESDNLSEQLQRDEIKQRIVSETVFSVLKDIETIKVKLSELNRQMTVE